MANTAQHDGAAAGALMSAPPFRPETVYLDTNPLVTAGWPRASAQLLQITDQAERLKIPINVPDPVNSELEGRWIRELKVECCQINQRIVRLNQRIGTLLTFAELPCLPSDDGLRANLKSAAKDFMQRVKVAPLTTRPLAEFLRLAIERGATFEEAGRGFQDAVILCSVLDDMKDNRIRRGVLVSEDKAFRNPGVVALEKEAGVTLRVVATLDELEHLLRDNVTEAIRRLLDRQHKQLMTALESTRDELEKYVVKNLTFAANDLSISGTIKRIGSIRLVSIENAHASHLDASGTVKISVDAKIAVEAEVMRFLRPEQQTLKAGTIIESPVEPTSFGRPVIQTETKQIVAVVEGVANKTGDAYSGIEFTSAQVKRVNPALMALARKLVRRKK